MGRIIEMRPLPGFAWNALDMAVESRNPSSTMIHSKNGSQAVHVPGIHDSDPEHRAGWSDGHDRGGYDRATIEFFWATMQVEILSRKKWRTWLELAYAIFDCIGIYYNKSR